MNLETYLFGLSNNQLKARAQLVQEKYLPTRKADMVRVIVTELMDPQRLRARWAQLDTLAQKAVAAAVHQHGVLDTSQFAAQYGALPALGAAAPRTSLYGYSREKATPVALFFYDGWHIPDDLMALLKPVSPLPERYQIPTVSELPNEVDTAGPAPLQRAETERATLHDWTAALRLIADGQLSVGDKTGLPSASAVHRLAKELLIPDYYPIPAGSRADDAIRPFGLLVLAQSSSWAKANGTKLTLTRKGEAWLQQPDVAGLRAACQRWVASDFLDELRRIKLLKGQQARGQRYSPLDSRRNAILQTLAEAPTGRWIRVADFFRALRAWGHDFAIETGSHTRLYIQHQEYGWLGSLSGTAYWQLVQGQYTLVVLFEYLAAFGALDLAYVQPEEANYPIGDLWGMDDEPYVSRYDGLQFIRLTPLGAYLLGAVDDYAGPAPLAVEPLLKVLPNAQVIVTDREHLAPNDRALLERIGAQESDDVYRLQRALLLAAFESGITQEAIQEFLQSKSGGALPQTVDVLLQDVQRNSQQLAYVGEAILLQAADAALAQLIVSDRALRESCWLVGERLIVVNAAQESMFRRRLKQLGYGVRRP